MHIRCDKVTVILIINLTFLDSKRTFFSLIIGSSSQNENVLFRKSSLARMSKDSFIKNVLKASTHAVLLVDY